MKYFQTDNGSGLLRDGHEHKDPEALVRAETRVIDFLRCLVIGFLLLVATSLSIATFKLSRKWEIDSFHLDFDGIASRMTQTFLVQTNTRLWYANALSVAITDLANNSFPNTSIAALYNLGPGFRTIANAQRAYWSPYLRNEAERTAWEAYVQKEARGNVDPAVCYVCGGPDKFVGAPNALVPLPNIRPYNCRDIQTGGNDGLIPESSCSLIQSYVMAHCECKQKSKSGTTVRDGNSNRVFQLQNGTQIPVTGNGPSFPVWQTFAANQVIMYDQFSSRIRRNALQSMLKSGLPTYSLTSYPDDEFAALLGSVPNTPVSSIFYPVFGAAGSRDIVGTFTMDFRWEEYFYSQIPVNSDGLAVVFENTQGQAFTFKVEGDELIYVGKGDIHDSAFDSIFKETTLEDFQKLLTSFSGFDTQTVSKLKYKVRLYPSHDFRSRYLTSKPALYTTVVVLIFVFTSMVFIIYDYLVRKRQQKVMSLAMRDDAIVSSLFPANFRERLFDTNVKESQTLAQRFALRQAPRAQLRTLLGPISPLFDGLGCDSNVDPIADFFPRCSVIFADINGFTAWSSEREPAQVFRLLETVYRAFDQLAKKHGVFKIETVGDCYVAATGVPEAQEDHAVRIVCFARDCLIKMGELTKSLETLLGPSTADLSIRIGVHSGPVTGGVLRGDKARFQLFGDTMNTAARMESTGEASRIQVSPTTAELLQQSGMSQYLTSREGGVIVKGKGSMLTYWVDENWMGAEEFTDLTTCLMVPSTSEISIVHPSREIDSTQWGSASLDSTFSDIENKSVITVQKEDRLVDWHTDLLLRLLQRIAARRNAASRKASFPLSRKRSHPMPTHNLSGAERNAELKKREPIEDIADVLTMPEFSGFIEQGLQDPDTALLGEHIKAQLREYVRCVAAMYLNNPFHNFEHASHVAMSAWKIMNRIIKPQNVDYSQNLASKSKHTIRKQIKALAEEIHQSTFGISSDPLMQFAVVFCALIHDADHTGVTNAQLIKEEHEVALQYSGKCVAEQNSVHICWTLLMEDRFDDLRSCICATEEESNRFRQLVVNAVIATDIADKELQMSRKNRWDMAFANQAVSSVFTEKDIHRKATVVFEYIIQASDVAHTMQHWYVYNKWNERLFEERYSAYLVGRESIDPSVDWYKGELWFFDNYIIPLANKLEHCGVFGVSSDEYLNYALENRREWEVKGEEIVQSLIAKYCDRLGSKGQTVTRKDSFALPPTA